ncbi:MAG TPA: ABC transporter substrate-binding protein [Rhodobacteraceae bacterium]|nr:ABC transporter substrate-binding protein [Paracoccaceae bacterium]
MRILTAFLTLLLFVTGFPSAISAETLRVSVLKFGTVNWELDVIKHNGFDQANGFDMQVQGVANKAAAEVAFQGGEADIIVSDWIWVARQRAAGKDYVFIPYSKAVGGLMVPSDSPVKTLADLKGKKIGIAGGPVDKSWLILRAYAQKTEGFDLKGETEQVFGAPPLIFKTALKGDIDGVINFWHFMAKLDAKGFRSVVSVADAAQELGLDPETPLLGYVVKGDLLREKPQLVAGFAAASRAAKELLARDDAEWDRLRPRMKAKDDATFAALKAGFRAGIPSSQPVKTEAASKFLALMSQLGGEKLVGNATTLPDGIFYTPGS